MRVSSRSRAEQSIEELRRHEGQLEQSRAEQSIEEQSRYEGQLEKQTARGLLYLLKRRPRVAHANKEAITKV